MYLDNPGFRALKSHMMLIPGNPGSARLSEAMAVAFGWPRYQEMKEALDALEFDLSGLVPKRLISVNHEAMILRLHEFGVPEIAAKTLALSLAWSVQAEFMALEPEEHAFLSPGRILDRQTLGAGYISALHRWYQTLCQSSGEQPRLHYTSNSDWSVTISTEIDPEGAFDYTYASRGVYLGPDWELFLDLDERDPDLIEIRTEKAIEHAIAMDIPPERALFTLARHLHESYLQRFPKTALRLDRHGIAALVAIDEEHLFEGRLVEVWLAEF